MKNPLRIRPPFQCPVCRNEQYAQIEITDRYGQPKKIQSYHCRGCSVVFKDPELFTRHREKAVSTEQLYRYAGQEDE
jgi:hypothetical protein